MENGLNGPLADEQVSQHTNNGVVAPIMAKLPEGNITINQSKINSTEIAKVNGGSSADLNEENSYSSESDALVIDETISKKEKVGRKTNNQKLKLTGEEEDTESISNAVTHSNPYFNESLFELSQLHQNNQEVSVSNENLETLVDKVAKKLKKKGKAKPKIREYAQYLGLQPSVQFKCPKCNRSGFESLSSLQDHVVQCTEETVQEISQDNSYSGFKLTRKVFLCSACGTYYENWNLYIHMLEFHKRFICLYCLGMFSILEDLCQHIQSKHNLEPGYKNTLDEFFNVYNEPCYIACCECNKLFSEQDNFFYHNCINNKNKCKKTVKQQITPENHVTGESEPFVEPNMEDTMKSQNMEITDNTIEQNYSDNVEINEKQEIDAMETNLNEINCQGSTTPIKNNTVCNNVKDNLTEIHEHTVINNEDTSIPSDSVMSKCEPNDVNNELDNESVIPMEAKISEDDESSEREVIGDEFQDTRKVPKLSLKLPKPSSYEAEAEDSDDSDKLTMEIDQIESEYENENNETVNVNTFNNPSEESEIIQKSEVDPEKEPLKRDSQFQVAGIDIPIIELQLEQPLDKFDPRNLLQKCLKMTIPTCIYCNHARKIAVNGKQLGLHCIAEHRFSAVVNSITAEELIPENFVNRIKESLDELSSVFFNLDSSFSNEAVTFSHLFECFQCHFSTTVHKELYLHNRKYHSKNLLLCIMCKSNFYSYSELICHLCPGVYVLDYELQFRCCMCVHDDLPSSFRLMVHLRKKHNVCDVCLETCHTQHRLSNHVWKHKLHHFCYRCGIAYRNKPDITRHLFWKHGTESVMCKKCLQKKWPHVYHFCVPPASFVCEECSLMFTKAVSFKVHKRLHSGEKKHACTFDGCEEKFISKKLFEKHYNRHLEPPEEPKVEEHKINIEEVNKESEKNEPELVKEDEKLEEKPKQKIDVLEDLPALNLSESDSSSESESEDTKVETEKPKDGCLNPETELEPPGDLPPLDILQEMKAAGEVPGEESSNAVMQNIWDNFKTYQEQQQKLDNMFVDQDKSEMSNIPIPEVEEEPNVDVILQDHDYCVNTEPKAVDTTLVEVKPALQESVDHDYCFTKPKDVEEVQPSTEPPAEVTKNNKKETKKPGSSSSSSSDSDSSSCSCGSNCSCSSSSGGGSSSSSDSSSSESSSEEGKQRQLAKKQKRKERAKKLKEEKEKKSKVDVVTTTAPIVIETPIRESDLETTESETDEEFYDEAPQKLAKKILEEKRQQLLELMGPNSIPNGSFIESTSRPPTPPAEVREPEERKKKKSKSKKKKKKKSEKRALQLMETEVNNIIPPDIPIPPYYQQFHQQQQIQPQSVAPITLTISRNSPISSPSASISTPSLPPAYHHKVQNEHAFSKHDSAESKLRASKRRRVPNKFYGYSSDEDQEKQPASKWRKTEAPQPPPRSPQVVPPITIKTQPPPPPPPQPPIVEPISIRTGTHLSDFRVARPRPKPSIPPIRLLSRGHGDDSASDSNDSSSEEPSITPKPAQPQLYCYCQCPYDEVSEMIGCDATDCEIEWFHFECVGIMVPPKGQWFCPDCRKKKARREIIQNMKSQSLN